MKVVPARCYVLPLVLVVGVTIIGKSVFGFQVQISALVDVPRLQVVQVALVTRCTLLLTNATYEEDFVRAKSKGAVVIGLVGDFIE